MWKQRWNDKTYNINNLPKKKQLAHEGDGDTYCIWCNWNSSQKINKTTEGIENQTEKRDHPNHSIFYYQPENLEESWRPEESWWHLNSSERQPA